MFDVAVIGGGVCGCPSLHELSRHKVNAVLSEREDDASVGTTKVNSAIVHTGYDPEPGILMIRYNVEGNRIVEQFCADLDTSYDKIGSLALGFSEEDRAVVEALYRKGVENGMPGPRIVEKEELHQMEPMLGENVLFALWVSSAAIINPWELAIAQAEVAVQGGAKVILDAEVTGIEKNGDVFTIETSQGPVQARLVVNVAGMRTDRITAIAGDSNFQIIPNHDKYFVLDTTQGKLVSRVILQCPTKVGKGILASSTVHGNLIVGPNVEDVSVDDADTTSVGLHNVRQAAIRSVPSISFRDPICSFTGVRAISTQDGFIVGPSEAYEGFFNIVGIKSPRLISPSAIAYDMMQMLHHVGLELSPNPDLVSKRHVPRFKSLSPKERSEAILRNPLYGTIVCRCETVIEGEIVDTMHRPLPLRSIDGIKRCCTPGVGCCQGGLCGPRVQAIITRELGIPKSQVLLDRTGTHIILGRTKEQKEAGK